MRHGVKLSKKHSPNTYEELKRMLDIPYASAVGSIQYAAQYTRPDIAYTLSVTSRYQDTIVDSTTKAEYIAASKATKEAIQELGVVPNIVEPVVIFFDNNEAIAQAKEPRSHHRSKHILRRYNYCTKMVGRGDVWMD
ncbi:hypothetical protein Sango_2097000 [Sesamum angolense]|uniref:Uncharacterized protein n=1 Tax=Sesamum angolense TaxID=2727404 RepID=A0AAE1WBH5_9LAMI|nr:hypothetical protein Sango_2097000 [Sesamum angolense]